MAQNSKQPSITETAFDCPHCGAYTTQYWFKLSGDPYSEKQRTPAIPDQTTKKKIEVSKDLDSEAKDRLYKWVDKIQTGLVELDRNENGSYFYHSVENLFLSRCYNCKKTSVWVHQSLVFPPQRIGQQPNIDLPPDITHDFEEARSILNLSPRGAAALLRLAVQKLCAHLGEKGKNIDDDIASLVSKGLNPLIQKSLDVVRVVGNEAVHPGMLDLKDDRDTAIRLLGLVNLIAEQMITHPKTIQEMYEDLPEGKRKAIELRNERALGEDKK